MVPAAADVTIDLTRAVDAEAIGIVLTGMLIVFCALILITLFISQLPRLLEALASVLPEEYEPSHPADPESSYPDEDAIVAALSYILHQEMQQRAADG